MPESGSCMFTDADDYQASFGGALDLVVARPRHFQARLTWVKLPHLRLLRAEEALPRAAYVSVPAEPVFVSFPARRDSLLICDGASAQFGEVMMHRRGAHFHQRLVGPARWGSISLRPEHLSYFSMTIAERDLAVPQANQIFCPRPADRLRLLGLYARACRVTETDLDRIAHPEVARALEQDLDSRTDKMSCERRAPRRLDGTGVAEHDAVPVRGGAGGKSAPLTWHRSDLRTDRNVGAVVAGDLRPVTGDEP